MTKEELKKEAEEYAEGMAKYYASTHEGFIPSQFEKYLRNACVSSAEPREKRIAELINLIHAERKRQEQCDDIHLKKIAELEKENAELKEQINEWLNAYSDTNLVKVLRDCIYKNEKLSSQEQQQLSAWVECAMDFGSNLDECADQLTKAKELLKQFLEAKNSEDTYKAEWETEQFLKDSEVEK